MTERVQRALGALAVLTPFVVGLTAAGVEREGREVFRFQDSEIVESSGLVAEGDLVHTVNDSGDTGRVFTVDTRTGETVGVTFWADGPRDVEALAPAGPGHVWVADIGDNSASRDSVQVTRVPVGVGDRTVEEETIELVYPDGARDAEALLAHPVTGRLYVATKGFFGGELYAAPPEPADDAPNMLGLVGSVAGIVTDATFLGDGSRLVLRTYSNAVVYSFPALEVVASFDLPSQQQGEGIAVLPGPSPDSVLISSEGLRAPVLEVPLPRALRQPSSPSSPSSSSSTSPSSPSSDAAPTAAPVSDLVVDASDRDAWPWIIGVAVLLGAVLVLVRSLRPR